MLITPKRLLGLIIEDIAPKQYDIRYAAEFAAMNNLALETVKNRNDADKAMETSIPDWTWRQFLLTNLTQTNKNFHWQINLPVLTQWLPKLWKTPSNLTTNSKAPPSSFAEKPQIS